MEEEIKKLEKEIKKLERLNNLWIDSEESENLTPLEYEMKEKYEKIWEKALEICQKEKIKTPEEFDSKYPIFEFGLEEFIEEIIGKADYWCDRDSKIVELEIKILTEALNQFKFDNRKQQEYELLIIRDMNFIGKKEESEKEIDKWIKEHPEIGEGYEVKCNFELSKRKSDMEKIAKILDEAKKNNTYVPDEDIYEEVIKYYSKLGDEEKEDYYESLLEFVQEQEDDDYDDELEDIFDFDDYLNEQEENILLEEKKEIIQEIKEFATSKVAKNKRFEEYITDNNEEMIMFLGQRIILKADENDNIRKDINGYILNHYKEILSDNMKYMTDDMINVLKKFPNSDLLELDLKKQTLEGLFDIVKIFPLTLYKIAFMECKKDKLLIAIPLIKEIKENLKNKEIMKINKNFNEKKDIIIGMCEVYGAIEGKKLWDIMKKIDEKIDKEELVKILLIMSNILSLIKIKIDHKISKVKFIYKDVLDEKDAKEIIKAQKELNIYKKEQYIKFGTGEFLNETKGYKKIKKEIDSIWFLDDVTLKMLKDIIQLYIFKIQTNSNGEEILEKLLYHFKEIKDININNIKKGFEELKEELPKWK